ncbi:WD40 repeat domain-containing protein [Anoxybacteroides tepidamans]|uniref:WD40 repeat domain-containing protein n=1 Tax=Anoxybacteroides tepidamans TaxID=265948 RepID=UPI00048193D1|nr:WD40 repeat domain-containing protein [Anoxybacillus tepidamans]
MIRKSFILIIPFILVMFYTPMAYAGYSSVKIGPQIQNVIAMNAAAGTTSDGTPQMYITMQGEPAKLVVVNLETNQLVDEKPLASSSSAWAITVNHDGMVWIGGTPTAHLYKYNPNTKQLTDIGKVSGSSSTSIHDLEVVGSDIYGSSSPNGDVFKYTKEKGFTNYGQVISGKKLARSLAYSSTANTLFVGLGAKAELVAWNLKTNQKLPILPQKYKAETSIYDLDEAGGILFAKLEPSKKILLFDAKTYKFLGELPASSRGVSPKAPDENVVYYTHQYQLYRFNLNTKTSEAIPGTLKGTEAVSLDFVKLRDGNDALVGLLGNSGTYLFYNLKTGEKRIDKLPLPPQAVTIYNIATGPNGWIYSSGFVSGQLGIFNPVSQQTMLVKHIGQAESMMPFNGKLYLGVYPGAIIYEWNPNQPETATPLFSIGYGQDRPLSMTAANHTLFIGSHPKNGEIGGALTVYDIQTKQKITRRNLIPEQSVSALTYYNGYVYGGTSIFSGKNLSGKVDAVFFRLRANKPTSAVEKIKLPLAHPRLIHALMAGPNGKIWGLSDGNLFTYDPKKNKTSAMKIVPTTSGYIRNGTLLAGKDGWIYGVVERKLFRINPNTDKLEFLVDGAEDIAQDNVGNLYYKIKENLWMLKKE